MDPFLGQIMLCALQFPPRNWADCNGQLIPVSQNAALFALLGTSFGGDGKNYFGLPDLRGRVPVSPGTLPGGSTYVRGEQTGIESIAITAATLPAHGHGLNATVAPAAGDGSGTAVGNSFAALPSGRGTQGRMYASPPATIKLGQAAVLAAGGNQSHSNLQPYLTLRYIIALVGEFPQRP